MALSVVADTAGCWPMATTIDDTTTPSATSLTLPPFNNDAFGVNQCDINLMLKKVVLKGMRLQLEKKKINQFYCFAN